MIKKNAKALSVGVMLTITLVASGCSTNDQVADNGYGPGPDAFATGTNGYVSANNYTNYATASRYISTSPVVSSQNLNNRIRRGLKLTDRYHNYGVDQSYLRQQSTNSLAKSLATRGQAYLPIIVSELEANNMPMELAFLPHIESRYNPEARSSKQAVGLWQFIPGTARAMGLRLNQYEDQRRDVQASTRAAIAYLRELYSQFNNWELAMAAYNCGPGCVARAIDKNRDRGLPTDFYSLPLPAETRNYVPQILAAAKLYATQNGGIPTAGIATKTVTKPIRRTAFSFAGNTRKPNTFGE